MARSDSSAVDVPSRLSLSIDDVITRAGAVPTVLTLLAVMLVMRFAMGIQLDGLDDAGYLEAAQRVSRGESLTTLFPLFRTRVGMAYPLGWLIAADWIRPSQFWLLTLVAEGLTILSLLVAGRHLGGSRAAGFWAAFLYAIYPLAVQQGMMYYPTAFQVASISAALALIGVSERSEIPRRVAVAFVAGVLLGLGYLVKEDTALVVPALVLVAAAVRFPRISTTLAVCGGAAVVFLIESLSYWLTTGDPLFRLTATSGLGFVSQDDMRIGAIYGWAAYPRTLWLMPVQVGLMWWLLLPAIWAALRRPARSATTHGIMALALLMIIIFAYLQFGSGSFRDYSPLPKSPRYTALVTPMLALLVGIWLAQLVKMRPQVARWVVAGVVVSAVPCIMFLSASSSERTRNTIMVLPVLEQARDATLYSDYFSIRLLRLLQRDSKLAVWFHARFNTGEFIFPSRPDEDSGAYVLVDQQIEKIYTSSYELQLPATVASPPPGWKVVWTGRAYPDGSIVRVLLEGMRHLLERLPSGATLRVRGTHYISDMIDNDRATLYQVQ